MIKMRRIIFAILIVLTVLSVCPTWVFAAGPINPDQDSSLTIAYKDGMKAIPDARFAIYKVADVDEYSKMTLTPEFEPYRNTVSGLNDLEHLTQDQWAALSSTLRIYVLKDDIAFAASGNTDNEGILFFENINPGLYLVIGSRSTTDDYYTYTPIPFMVFIPYEDPVNNEWKYDVVVNPKYTKDYNPPDDDDVFVTRKVLKIWEDSGYESIRPTEVIVQLLMDGEVYDTQRLNEENNWRYAWDNLDANHEWEVVEKVPEGYAVTTTREGITFKIVNKYVVPITGTNLPIQKRITGDKPKTDSVFTFVFSAQDISCPMPDSSGETVKEIEIIGAGSKEIGEITFEKPGIYVYTVSEKDGGVQGYTYDNSVYTVTYEVTEKDGDLSITGTIKDNKGNTASVIEFTNPYKTPGNNIPQTGVLWWPVPVLLFAGCAFVMIGIIRRRRCD